MNIDKFDFKNITISVEQKNHLKDIISKYFKNGIRLDSELELRRLRNFYYKDTGRDLEFDDSTILSAIHEMSITSGCKAYIVGSLLDETIRNKLLDYLNKQFEKGKKAIYFDALYSEFKNDFLDYNMNDSCMLRDYLMYVTKDQYIYEKDYIAIDSNTAGEPIDELRVVLKEEIEPIDITNICKKLSHLSETMIQDLLQSNSEFIRNKKGEFFHADNYSLSDVEKQNVIALIKSKIESHKFVSANELYNYIKTYFPDIYEKNACFSIMGCKNSLKHHLKDYFSFNGNIISEKGKELSMTDVFFEFAKERMHFSLSELSNFAENLDTPIKFDALFKEAFRISKEEFIPKGEMHFDVKKTDEAIDRFCNGAYISISNVNEFAGFPSLIYTWNKYLLEQYVACKSEKFCLIHGGYNKNNVVGAIVRKSSNINSLDDLIIDVLACSGIKLENQSALNYLVLNGYIAKRKYAGIETIILRANAKRNKKEML